MRKGSPSSDKSAGKLRREADLLEILQEERDRGKRIVFTNGCFDLLHHGHVNLLESARTLGDVLVVAINDDDSVRRLKSSRRPLTPLEERVEILEALEAVDYIVAFSEDDPGRLIRTLEPDVLVKGADWNPDRSIGANHVLERGGKVHSLALTESISTSAVIDSIMRGVEKGK